MVTLNSAAESATAEEAIYYAQIIADAFTKPFEKAQCPILVPMAVYADIERRKDDLDDIVDSVTDNDDDDDWTDGGGNGDIVTSTPIDSNKTRLASDISRALHEKCISCDIGLPKFNFSGNIGEAVADFKNYIDGLKNQFRFSLPNPAELAFALSFLCIPDLLRLLALILAIIAKLISGFTLYSFSITAFIMGIIGAILKILFKYVDAMVSISMSPLMCILNAISDILDQLPTVNNIRRSITNEESETLGISKRTEPDTVDILRSKIDGYRRAESKTDETVNVAFTQIQDLVNECIASLQESVDDLISVKTYFECESERSGPTIGQQIEKILQLMQIANLIRSVISKKGSKAAMEKMYSQYNSDISGLSNYSEVKDNVVLTPDNTESLSIEEIGQSVSDALGVVVDIVNDEQGSPMGVLIRDKVKIANFNRLSLYSCNLQDFIDDSNLDNIISDITDGGGDDGLTGKVSVLDLLPTDNVSVINPNDIASVSDAIGNILDMLGYLNRNTSNTSGEDNGIVGGNPNTGTIIKPTSPVRPKPSEVTAGLTSSLIPPSSGSTTNIALKCGSIDSIISTIQTLKKNEDI